MILPILFVFSQQICLPAQIQDTRIECREVFYACDDQECFIVDEDENEHQ